jgi:F-type H+-transporting ATPase subunit epsilon
MAKSFKVSIVTPEKTAFEADSVSVVLPGTEGYLGIWANHAPLVTGLKPGVVTLRDEEGGRIRYLSISGGFVEVSENKVSILCDSCEPAGEIDLQRAKAALERARKRLLAPDQEVDLVRAQQAAERAQARIHAAYLLEGHRN